jgi:hypothetical protein
MFIHLYPALLFYTDPRNKYHLAFISKVRIWKVFKWNLLPRWNFIWSCMCDTELKNYSPLYIKWRDPSETIDGLCGGGSEASMRGHHSRYEIDDILLCDRAHNACCVPPRAARVPRPSPIHHHFCKWRNNMSCAWSQRMCVAECPSLTLSLLPLGPAAW